MKLLKNTYNNFCHTNLHRTVWQNGGPDAGVDSGMSSEYEEDFAISTETDKEKARLEQEVTARREAKEKRDRLIHKEFYTMVGSDKDENIKDFCDFIDELYEKYLNKAVKHKEDTEDISVERMKETIAQVAEIAVGVIDIDKVIKLKKKSKGYKIIIHSETSEKDTGKIDGISFTFKDDKSEFYNLDYTDAQKVKIFKPIFVGLKGMANEYDKLTQKQKEEIDRKRRKENKLAHITDAKRLASKEKTYKALTDNTDALPFDVLDKLSYPLSEIAKIRSKLKVDDDGNYVSNDEYDNEIERLSGMAIDIIRDYELETPFSYDEEEVYYDSEEEGGNEQEKEDPIDKDINRIEDLFGIE